MPAVAGDSGRNGGKKGQRGGRACALMGRISDSLSHSLSQFWGLRIFVACLQSDLSDQFPLCLSPLSFFPPPSFSSSFSDSFVLFCSFAWHLFNPQRDAASSLKSLPASVASVAGRCMGRFIVISTPAVVVVVIVVAVVCCCCARHLH